MVTDLRGKFKVLDDNLAAFRESVEIAGDYSPSLEENRLLEWLSRVSELPGKSTVRIAILLLRKAMTLGRKWHIMIAPKDRDDIAISRVAAYEALVSMEAAGLVSVRHCRGRSALVSIIDADSRRESGE